MIRAGNADRVNRWLLLNEMKLQGSILFVTQAPEQKWLRSVGYKGDGYWMHAGCEAVAASSKAFYTHLIEFFIYFVWFVLSVLRVVGFLTAHNAITVRWPLPPSGENRMSCIIIMMTFSQRLPHMYGIMDWSTGLLQISRKPSVFPRLVRL